MIGAPKATFTNDNPRFRKAYIRERLAALKAERDALVAEREKIDLMLAAEKQPLASLPKADPRFS